MHDFVTVPNFPVYNCNIKYILMYFGDDSMDADFVFFVQLIVFLETFHIHKNKWADSKPHFVHFYQESKQYISTIKNIRNKKAITNLKYQNVFLFPFFLYLLYVMSFYVVCLPLDFVCCMSNV